MIVDGHAHIGNVNDLEPAMKEFLIRKKVLDAEGRGSFTPEGLVLQMDQAQIDKAVVFPLTLPNSMESQKRYNDFTVKAVEQFPERLIGFGVVNLTEITSAVKELAYYFESGKLSGIKLHPSLQRVQIDDPKLNPLYDLAVQLKIPILFHTGAGPTGYSDKGNLPILLETVLIKFPKLKAIMAHVGRPFYDEAAFILRKYPGVYTDISANKGRHGGPALLRQILLYLHVYAGAIDRVFFGTDSPVFTYEESLRSLYSALEGGDYFGEKVVFTDSQKAGILGENILNLLNKANEND